MRMKASRHSYYGPDSCDFLLKLQTVSNATSARRHLSVRTFCSILFSMGCTCEKKITRSLKQHLFPLFADTKAASIPAWRQSEIMAQGFLDLFFDAATHLEYFFQFSSSALKRDLIKRHLTLSLKLFFFSKPCPRVARLCDSALVALRFVLQDVPWS